MWANALNSDGCPSACRSTPAKRKKIKVKTIVKKEEKCRVSTVDEQSRQWPDAGFVHMQIYLKSGFI